ncbi:DNA repair exonuclease [uncultured Aquabacterium sp.]|jgi:DNA repair exonuclease SbcCD nuclease subunit|uniref:metallophosphoesterase family protein n=1 Tax=uncultured Aquabacterium sp. TaxID=158753 RepID=UPI002616B3F6|nr:DNA repair exonuclease [uncultured Aquabacterium sp.]
MPIFLHTADWQIGRQYPAFEPDNAVPMAAARLEAVHRLAQVAAAEGAQAVLVAGDVFDAQTVSDKTVRQLFQAMAGWAGPWVLLPGNHDAALAESVWSRAQRLGVVPPNVHLALKPEVLLLPEAGLALLPAPLTQRHTHNDLTIWFDTADTPPGLLRVGLAHGSITGILAEDIDSANPIAPDRATRARLDYLALGDWHGARQIDARTWYSGTPEPDRFRNNEAGLALRVQIDGPGAAPVVTPIRVGQLRWQQWEAGLHQAGDVALLVERLQAMSPADVLDITLQGELDLAAHQRLDAALAEAEARLRSLRVDRHGLRLRPTDADLAALHADGYVGEVVAELRDDAEAGSDVAREALVQLTALLAELAPETPAGGTHAAA